MPRRAVIIVAGGTGTRMKSKIAKQFMVVAGKPILIHTFEAFKAFDPEAQFVLVLHQSLNQAWEDLQNQFGFNIAHTLVSGGEERYHSVKNGIAAIDPRTELVAIHDAVRPLVTTDTIARCFAGAEKAKAAVPVVPVTDTIRQKFGESSHTLPRKDLVAVQTPQCFEAALLKSAYGAAYQDGFTDDASVVEHFGQEVCLVEGEKTNIKITTKEDLLIADSFLTKA